MAALHNGVKPILSRQHIFDVAGVKTDTGDPPVMRNAQAGKVIEVNGLVRAVKVARADVNDTTLKGRSVIGWHVNALRMQTQCRVAQGNASFRARGEDIVHTRL